MNYRIGMNTQLHLSHRHSGPEILFVTWLKQEQTKYLHVGQSLINGDADLDYEAEA